MSNPTIQIAEEEYIRSLNERIDVLIEEKERLICKYITAVSINNFQPHPVNTITRLINDTRGRKKSNNDGI